NTIHAQVEAAVRGVYAADGMYWIAESLLYTIVFGTPEKSLTQICGEPEFASNEYGKCVCKMDTGFSFCIYKVFAQFFKDAEYIKCDGGAAAAVYVAEKKPTSPPPTLAHSGSGSGSAAA
ncbi:hypothetical protein PENTCL1PPCAC_12396, partial [Pristionchus entomophagus]